MLSYETAILCITVSWKKNNGNIGPLVGLYRWPPAIILATHLMQYYTRNISIASNGVLV